MTTIDRRAPQRMRRSCAIVFALGTAALALPATAAPPRLIAVNETLEVGGRPHLGAPQETVPAVPAASDAPSTEVASDESTAVPRAPGSEPAPTGGTDTPAYTEDRPLGAPRGAVLNTATADAMDAPGLLSSLDPRHGEVGRVIAALAIVIAIILAARLVMRRAAGVLGGGARPAGVLEVLARYPIARGQHLLLLRMGQRIVLLHQGQQGIRSLAEVNDPSEVAALLARMEAGARADEARQFRRTLEAFESEHERIAIDPSRGEIVDLTRGRRRPRPSLFGGGIR